MNELLSMLLYLGFICSPCTYPVEVIHDLEQGNATSIEQITNDSNYFHYVVTAYSGLAAGVVIIDDEIDY